MASRAGHMSCLRGDHRGCGSALFTELRGQPPCHPRDLGSSSLNILYFERPGWSQCSPNSFWARIRVRTQADPDFSPGTGIVCMGVGSAIIPPRIHTPILTPVNICASWMSIELGRRRVDFTGIDMLDSPFERGQTSFFLPAGSAFDQRIRIREVDETSRIEVGVMFMRS